MTSVPPTQPPAAPETDVRLTEAEKDALWDATNRAYVDTTTWDHEVESEVERAVERIVAERVRVVEGERECECPTDDYCPKCHPRWYAKWVKREIENLRRWKSEALPVIDGLQDLGHALGLPLGERITGPAAVEAARNLTARAESAEAAHRALQARLETLAVGMLHEADHLDQLGDHEEAGSVRHYGHAIHTILRAGGDR